MNFITKLVTNKIFLYLTTRYITYFVQFVTSMVVAVKLGPYYFGIWSFILLLEHYFRIINFGVSNSLNVLLVQNNDNIEKTKNYMSSANFLVGLICVAIAFIAIYYKLFGIKFFEKYQIGWFFYIICLVAILQHFNNLFSFVYRVKNRLFELAFNQSIIPILVLFVIPFFADKTLILVLLTTHLFGNLISMLLFIRQRKIPFGGKLLKEETKTVFNKGKYLFVYNACFYLIIVASATAVSIYYPVVEYGFYNFSYTLANVVVLLLNAFSFIIFPKVLYKLNSNDFNQVRDIIKSIRNTYVASSHLLLYIAIATIPFLISFVPKYQATSTSIAVAALAIMPYSNAFGFNTFLMAQNEEKLISKISAFSLIINILLLILLVIVLKVSYKYVMFSVLISYFVFSYLCVYFGRRKLNVSTKLLSVLLEMYPIRFLVPLFLGIILTVGQFNSLYFLPLVVFIALNIDSIKTIFATLMRVIHSPSIIDLK